MDVKLLRESIETGRAVEERTSEITVEGDTIVPDTMPDIQKILQIDGRARVTACTRQGDKLLCEGVAAFCILYIPEQEESAAPVESIETTLPFKDVCAASFGEDGHFVAQADLTRIGSMLLNSRKLSVKAEVSLTVREWTDGTCSITTGVTGEAEPEVKTRLIHAKRTAAEGLSPITVTDTLEKPSEKPPLSKILKMDAAVLGQEVKMITNKAILKGAVRLSTLYLSDTVPADISFMEHDVPFTEILDMPGAAEGMDCTMDCMVDSIYHEADAESGKIGVEIILRAHATATEIVTPEILEDCYLPGYDTTLTRTPCLIERAFDTICDGLAARKLFNLPSECPSPKEVYNVVGKPVVKSAEMVGGKAEVEGYVETYVLYLTEDADTPLFCYQDTIPFSYAVAANAPADARITCRVSLLGCGFTLPASGGVDVRANLEICLAFSATETVENIDSITIETENSDIKRPSLVIAFVNEGETLWNIAKKYKTTTARIADANHLEETDVVRAGTRLLIP